MMIVYINFVRAVMNCDSPSARQIRMMKFAEIVRKCSNINILMTNKISHGNSWCDKQNQPHKFLVQQ
jgi:hypothetical protein